MLNIGNMAVDQTVYIPFNTYNANGASVTVTDLVDTDVKIHKDGGTTQRSSANGITVSTNYDGITGCHLISIDLSDNTDAGFYASGSDYTVRLEGITVATQTLNPWAGIFSIENRAASGSGLTQQQVRDSMKLAPTVGAPSSGSVDEHLDDIDLKTTNLPADPAAASVVAAGQVAIIVEVDANEAKIDLLQTDSTAIKAKTDNHPADLASEINFLKGALGFNAVFEVNYNINGKATDGMLYMYNNKTNALANGKTSATGLLFRQAFGATIDGSGDTTELTRTDEVVV